MENPTCFVIIGYGKKTSYANGKARILDLDETYNLLIKPVFDSLRIPCYRAIDKNVTGSIDKLMLHEIKVADIALVDLTTLNANVMWELGVRHALKPKHTIMICEKEQMNAIPFDINHFVVYSYTHSEEGIPYKEVDRFRKALTDVVQKVLNQDEQGTDSPVFTYLKDEQQDDLVYPSVLKSFSRPEINFSDLLQMAEAAKNRKDFAEAVHLFEEAKRRSMNSISLKDNLRFIISRLALCTYKSKLPDEKTALENARDMLEELAPEQTQDIEVLGVSGAIRKRLFELTGDDQYLEQAIDFYERGFQLRRDYYNGINTAFMLYRKSARLKQNGGEWEDVKLNADYFRNSSLDISLKREAEPDFTSKPDAIWILLTIAEAYHYKGNLQKMAEYEEKARKLAAEKGEQFAMSSYEEQKKKIEG